MTPGNSDSRAGGGVLPPPEAVDPPAPPPVEAFDEMMSRLAAEKPAVMAEQLALLEERYDLSDVSAGIAMTRGKPVQAGVRVRLPEGVTSWEDLASLSADEIKSRDIFPRGFMSLPHVKQEEGGMVFPKFAIGERG